MTTTVESYTAIYNRISESLHPELDETDRHQIAVRLTDNIWGLRRAVQRVGSDATVDIVVDTVTDLLH